MTFEPGTPVWRSSLSGGGPASVIRDSGGDYVRVELPTGREVSAHRKNIRPMHTPGRIPQLTRTPSLERAELSPVPKDVPWRSREYLDYIRDQPCASCGATAPNEAAHWGGPGKSGGMGTKASDALTMPLCHTCHRLQHDHGMGAIMSAEEVYRVQRGLLAKWVEAEA